MSDLEPTFTRGGDPDADDYTGPADYPATVPTTLPQVYRAICAVQADLAREGISKDRRNKEQQYQFRGIDDVFNALSPFLAKHGLCILPNVRSRTVTERTTKSGNPLFSVVCCVDFHFIAAADGSRHVVRTYGEAMDTADKATNKAMSAAYKYAALQAFAIPTEGDDNDADATTPKPAPKGEAKPQASKPTEPEPQPEVASAKARSEIKALLKSTGKDQQKFVEWIGATSLDTITPDQAARAIRALQRAATTTPEGAAA